MKNDGNVPANNATVVIPNAKQGCFGNTETKTATVSDIVILNNPTPIKDNHITEFPNNKKGIPPNKLIIVVLR